MRIADDNPIIKWENGQGNIGLVGVEGHDVLLSDLTLHPSNYETQVQRVPPSLEVDPT